MPIFRARAFLSELYDKYHRPEFIAPDPLQFVFQYESRADREVVGLIAACIAFGNVKQIARSVSLVLEKLPEPSRALLRLTPERAGTLLGNWRHRYADGNDLAGLLLGIGHVLKRHGSLENCFAAGHLEGHETVLPAMEYFVNELRNGSGKNYLLPSPTDGSACKRLNLFLRWMVRNDAVDPGIWTRIPASKLVIPLDTHMHRLSTQLGLTARKQGNMKTALDITEQFRKIVPDDPVRYDFALTRFGMARGADLNPRMA